MEDKNNARERNTHVIDWKQMGFKVLKSIMTS